MNFHNWFNLIFYMYYDRIHRELSNQETEYTFRIKWFYTWYLYTCMYYQL